MENAQASTVGELLRRIREERKLSLEDVNRHTRISIETLRCLEQDDIDALGSETYLKGFLKNYARFLKLDLDVVFLTLDRQRGRAHPGKGTLWDIEETMKEEKLKSSKIVSRFVVPILIIAIVILSWLYLRERNRPSPESREKQVSYLQVEVD